MLRGRIGRSEMAKCSTRQSNPTVTSYWLYGELQACADRHMVTFNLFTIAAPMTDDRSDKGSWLHILAASFLGWSLDAFDFVLLVFVLKDIAAEFQTDISNARLPFSLRWRCVR
jgi:hypothetical protein